MSIHSNNTIIYSTKESCKKIPTQNNKENRKPILIPDKKPICVVP